MNKDTRLTQEKRLFKAFWNQCRTMKQVSIDTGIDRANITRFCAKLRKHNAIRYVKKSICPITKHRAYLITTNLDCQC